MKLSLLTGLAIIAAANADTLTVCKSYASTITFTAYQTFTQSGAYLVGADGRIVSTLAESSTKNLATAANIVSISTNSASILLPLIGRPVATSTRPSSRTATPIASNGSVVGPLLTDFTATPTSGGSLSTGLSIDSRCTPTPTTALVCTTLPTGVLSGLSTACYMSSSTIYASSCTLGPNGKPVFTQAPILLSTSTASGRGSTRISTPSTLGTTSRVPDTSTLQVRTSSSSLGSIIASSSSSTTPVSSGLSQTLLTVQSSSTNLISTVRSGSVLISSSTIPQLPISTSTPSSVSSLTTITQASTTASPVLPLTTVRPLSTSSVISLATTRTSTVLTPIVTDQAYIDTVLRHHNIHRLNHTVPNVIWNASLAITAQKISQTCFYAHNTQIDCTAAGGCYGQNIAAGYAPTQMGFLISDGFYNSEVSLYNHYTAEPSLTTVQAEIRSWGHFSQIVWRGSMSVGCYTNDCSAYANPANGSSGLGNVPLVANIRPFFTVCNYYPPGNYIGSFLPNVLSPRTPALPSTHASYQCPTDANCANTATVPGSAITVNADGSVGLPSVGVGIGGGVTLNKRGTVRSVEETDGAEYLVGDKWVQ